MIKGQENLELGKWAPGQSGNPKGKPKGTLSSKTILRRYLAVKSGSTHPVTGEEVNCLEHAVLKIIHKAMKGDIAAFKEILDRFEGKPNQKLDITEHRPDDLETMTEAELKETAALIAEKLKSKIDGKPD